LQAPSKTGFYGQYGLEIGRKCVSWEISGLNSDPNSQRFVGYKGMLEMASDQSLRDQIGARVYEKVKSRYSLDESVSAMTKAIECAVR
jgi:hypothetical protein